MRVRVAYTVEISDDFRRAINIYFGREGLATREEVQSWLRTHGNQGDDDLMQDLWSARAQGQEPYPDGTVKAVDVLRR